MRVKNETILLWAGECGLALHAGAVPCFLPGATRDDVVTHDLAWMVASHLDIPNRATRAGHTEANLETALRKIFPNAY